MIAATRHKNLVFARQIPPDIRAIIQTLRDHGHDAKIVGGCIRDLLLEEQPKDFDVVSDADPYRIRDLFPRARVIGRRFKIVHVQRGDEVTEVSTYRRRSKSSRPRASKNRFNLYGSIEKDVELRDFTVNALYFDVEREEVIDFVNGLEDIGDPRDRFLEDPCRILRAARFIAKLPLTLDSSLERAIHHHRDLIAHLKPARMRTELEKTFLTGDATASYETLRQLNLTSLLFPQAGDDDRLTLSALQNTDARVEVGKPVTLAFLLAAVHWSEFRRLGQYNAQGQMAMANATASANAIIGRQQKIVSMPRYMQEFVTDTWLLQTQLERQHPKRVSSLLKHVRFRAAYDLLMLRAEIGDADPDRAQWWTDLQEMDPIDRKEAIGQLKWHRRRKRGGKVSDESLATAQTSQ